MHFQQRSNSQCLVKYDSMSSRSRSSDNKKTSETNKMKNAKIKLKEIFNGTFGTNFNLQNLKNS